MNQQGAHINYENIFIISGADCNGIRLPCQPHFDRRSYLQRAKRAGGRSLAVH